MQKYKFEDCIFAFFDLLMVMIEQFSVLLSKHLKLGHILLPYFIIGEGEDYFEVSQRVSFANIKNHKNQLSDIEFEIVKEIEEYNNQNLKKRFTNKKISPQEFLQNLSDKYIQDFIRPFIERQMAKCLSLIAETKIPVFFKENKKVVYEINRIEVEPNPAEIVFNFIREREETRYFQTIRHDSSVVNLNVKNGKIIPHDPCWLLLENKLYHFKEKVDGKKLKVFFDKEFIQVPQKLENHYYSTFVKKCLTNFPVVFKGFRVDDINVDKKAVLSLENDLTGKPLLQLYFSYGDKRFLPEKKKSVFVEFENKDNSFAFYRFQRDKNWEKNSIKFLTEHGLKLRYDSAFILQAQDNIKQDEALYNLVNWLNKNEAVLKNHNFKILQEYIKGEYFTGEITTVVKFTDKVDWFDVYAVVKFGDKFEIPLIKFHKHLLNGIREYLLPDGAIAVLPKEWFAKYTDLLSFCIRDKNRLKLKKFHYPLISRATEDSVSFQQRLKDLYSGFIPKEIKLPDDLKAKLRNYQVDGFRWMNFLKEQNFGGCLADDMGLGKTLQTLTLLLKNKKTGENIQNKFENTKTGQLSLFDNYETEVTSCSVSLIIMPASLVHNWANEITKFTPALNFIIYTGQNRSDYLKNFDNVNIILTTYGTIRNDYKILENFYFEFIILDESQFIKNPGSKIAYAVSRLNGNYRFTLSGTPVENSLTDLWSLMNFINKGLLGELAFFKKVFVLPIEKHNNEKQKEKLKLLIKPFILRRTKLQVEKELPELLEEYFYCEMTPEQKKNYTVEKSRVRNLIIQTIKERGIGKSSVIILQALTKLRQLANHPVLTDKDYLFDSGKFNEVVRNFETLISEGHKVLIFSSFVKHLNLFAKYFSENDYHFSMLIGKTRNRERVIKTFQEDDRQKAFLISIKAGGVGLNLTQADYVFLLDPWWNPAVENQAINRAHRIGQTKHVFAYRFITLDTIEEKILSLQQKKSRLADIFINTESPIKRLSAKNIEELFE